MPSQVFFIFLHIYIGHPDPPDVSCNKTIFFNDSISVFWTPRFTCFDSCKVWINLTWEENFIFMWNSDITEANNVTFFVSLTTTRYLLYLYEVCSSGAESFESQPVRCTYNYIITPENSSGT